MTRIRYTNYKIEDKSPNIFHKLAIFLPELKVCTNNVGSGCVSIRALTCQGVGQVREGWAWLVRGDLSVQWQYWVTISTGIINQQQQQQVGIDLSFP